MKIVIFGLTISSSWGNEHATLWRALCKAFAELGHRVVFYEKDLPYYSANRDFFSLPVSGTLHLYSSFDAVRSAAQSDLQDADLAIVSSCCPDGGFASEAILQSKCQIKTFYDLDTAITLNHPSAEVQANYAPLSGLGDFDLVLSCTGGRALEELQNRLGAQRVAPLYGSADPEAHFPVPPVEAYRSDLAYLGTYTADLKNRMEDLFLTTAHELPDLKFLIGGTEYPQDLSWMPNIAFAKHMPPAFRPAFFSSSRLTIHLTRSALLDYGYCPSGKLFEAAACGAPILSDTWDGLNSFFQPSQEILLAHSSQDVQDALGRTDSELRRMASLARERTLDEHTSLHRAKELESICDSLFSSWNKFQAAS